jgi:hypothetical protein
MVVVIVLSGLFGRSARFEDYAANFLFDCEDDE